MHQSSWALLRKLAILVVLLLFIYELSILARIWWWVGHNPGQTAFMELRLDELKERNPSARLRQRWVPYAVISSDLKRAVLAAEDAKFLGHEGFDWEGIQEALDKNLRKGRIVAGGSTVSQQLAKNLFLSGSRTPWRKGQEALITVMLEQMMSKRRILEIYLNVIEWGEGIYGAEAAARHYFGVSAAQLGPGQAARLAAMIPNPRYYDRHRETARLQRKTNIILARMGMAAVPR